MTELRILLVEDDDLLRKSITHLLRKWGHDAMACDCLAETRDAMDGSTFDLILLDMRLPDGDGLDFLEERKQTAPETEFVIVTAYADVRTAIAALKRGAYDYLPKPFEDEQLMKILRNVIEKVELTSRVASLSRLTSAGYEDICEFDEMIGTGVLNKVFRQAQLVARSNDTTVLITGESGTGKGMLARAIHRANPRRDQPFVDINCSAIPHHLLESEVFGYEKGAFTDAKNRKRGLLETANGGSVFLDEIGDMDLNLQGKILKVLEDKEFRRLGGEDTTKVDVRIIAATNRDLPELVREKSFREDLYFRLSVIPLRMPPLREHADSIEPLAAHYLERFCKRDGHKLEGFTDEARRAMRGHTWRGNVRELRNTVERGVILTTGDEIDVEALALADPHAHGSATGTTEETDFPPMSLPEAEKRVIGSVLKSVDGNRNKAAEILEIHRTTLFKKIKDYGLG